MGCFQMTSRFLHYRDRAAVPNLERDRISMKQVFDNSTNRSAVGGTLLSDLANISKEDISKTIVVAGVGAIVSFGVTLLLR
jgi:hypothetical protein